MLILSRHPSQSVVIDNDIRVTVLAIDGQRVRLGIEAPADTKIVRPDAKKSAPPPGKSY